MKKIIVTLAIAISSLSAFAGEENISPVVLDAFKSEFTTARQVEWTVGINYYMATFSFNDKYVFAYYNEEGDLLGLKKYISPDQLSMNLQISLQKKYSDFWISDLAEIAKNGRTDYYITLENADKKIVLVAAGESEWKIYSTLKKI